MYGYLGVALVLVIIQGNLFQMLLHRTGLVSKLLNPVTSGMVQLA